MRKSLWLSGGGDLPAGDPLTASESDLFDSAIETLSSISALARRMPELVMDHKEDFRRVAEIAKEKFNLKFGGVIATQGEFGVSFIRPLVLAYTTWRLNITAVGWQNIWGSSGTNITMPDSSGSRAYIAFPAVISYSPSPKFQELLLGVKGNIAPIIPILPWNRIGDIYVAQLGATVLVGPGEGFYMRGNAEVTGEEWLAPFGLEFAIGNYMRTET